MFGASVDGNASVSVQDVASVPVNLTVNATVWRPSGAATGMALDSPPAETVKSAAA